MGGLRRCDAGGGKRVDEAPLQRGRPLIGAGGGGGAMIGRSKAPVREGLAGKVGRFRGCRAGEKGSDQAIWSRAVRRR